MKLTNQPNLISLGRLSIGVVMRNLRGEIDGSGAMIIFLSDSNDEIVVVAEASLDHGIPIFISRIGGVLLRIINRIGSKVILNRLDVSSNSIKKPPRFPQKPNDPSLRLRKRKMRALLHSEGSVGSLVAL